MDKERRRHLIKFVSFLGVMGAAIRRLFSRFPVIAGERTTFCPFLWERVFIDEKGDVFACCHKKPRTLGNIYREKLENIYNNEVIKKFRQKSLDGQLGCFDGCVLLEKEKIKPVKRDLTIHYGAGLKKIRILLGEACNIDCIMCWQDHKDKERLDYTRFIENVDLTPFQEVEIQGGEPLLIRDAGLFFEYAAAKNKKVSFLTNGTLIDDEWAEKIARISSHVFISINAATQKTHEQVNRGSHWESVLKNIQKIKRAKARQHSPVEIRGHMTLVPENVREAPLFIRNAKQLGFDSVNFNYAARTAAYLKFRPFLRKKIGLEIKKALDESDGSLLVRSLYRLGRLGLLEFGSIAADG